MQVTIKADIIEDYDNLHILFYFSIYDNNPINILITVTDNITKTTIITINFRIILRSSLFKLVIWGLT